MCCKLEVLPQILKGPAIDFLFGYVGALTRVDATLSVSFLGRRM